jgi:hemerythrin
MKDIIWDQTLSVEVDEIDDDHRRLAELCNLINHSSAAGENKNYIEALLEELISCTIWHFRHEERLMLQYDYDGLEEHRNEHQELIEAVRDLQQEFQSDAQPLSDEHLEFLELWLTRHILSTDMELGRYLINVM